MRFAKNSATLTRHETVGGIDYLVAPVIALVEGILNEELVLAEEVGLYPDAWAGIPVVVPDHPTDDDDDPVTANTPEALAEIQIGQFFNPEMDGDKLRGELWIDVAKAKAVARGAEAVKLLEAGESIEVSTAYFRDLEELGGERDGVEFVGISRNIRPDHIAVLLDSIGACSWQDGCGTPRVNEEGSDDMKINILGTARTPVFDGAEEISWADVGKTFQAYRAGFYKNTEAEVPDGAPAKIEDAPQAMKDWIAARSLLGDPKADNFRDLRFFPVVNPSTNKLNAGAVRAVLGGRGALADIPQSAIESAQTKAEKLLDDHFHVESAKSNKLLTALKTVLGALGLIKNDESFGERERRIQTAWEAQFVAGEGAEISVPYPWIREIYEDNVIVEGSEGLERYPYSDTDGEVNFGQPERVEVAYEPIEEVTVDKDELIQKISGDGRLGLSDELLQGMDDAALEALWAYLESASEEEETPPGSEEIPLTEAATGNAPEETSTEVPETNEAPDAFATLADEFGGVEAVRAILTNAQRLAAQALGDRRVLINEVASLSGIKAEQLEVNSDETLIALRTKMLPADYTGQGGGEIQVNEELIPFPMPDVFSKQKEA